MFIPAGSTGRGRGGLSAAGDAAGLRHGCTELVGPQRLFLMALMGTKGWGTRGRGLWARREWFVQLSRCLQGQS